MKSSTLHIMPLIAMMGGAPSAIAAPALPNLPAMNASHAGTCGQYTPCCPPSTKISRDGDFKAVQQVTGNTTSNYQLKYTMQPALMAQMGAFANYLSAIGYTMFQLVSDIHDGGIGSTPVAGGSVDAPRHDRVTAPFSGSVTSFGHGTGSSFPLSVNRWYVVRSFFMAGGGGLTWQYQLECSMQMFAYRVEYKPMKVGAGTSMQPTVQIIPYTGPLPKLPAPQTPVE